MCKFITKNKKVCKLSKNRSVCHVHHIPENKINYIEEIGLFIYNIIFFITGFFILSIFYPVECTFILNHIKTIFNTIY